MSTLSPFAPVDDASNPVAVIVGKRLREARKARKLTLAHLDAYSGGEYKGSVVGAYERGERGITVVRLAGLAELYDVSLLSLLPGGEAETLSVKVAANARDAHRFARDLAAELGRLLGHDTR